MTVGDKIEELLNEWVEEDETEDDTCEDCGSSLELFDICPHCDYLDNFED